MDKMIGIGRGNFLPRSRILGFFYIDSHPVKRMINEKAEQNLSIDATRGKKTRSVILMDNGFIILSSVKSETLSSKFNSDD